MTAEPVLVTGATGRLGRLVVRRLLALGRPVRVLARRPDAARDLFGTGVEIAAGSFADRPSLDAASRGAGRLLLLSPIGASLAADQIAVADVAAAAGIRRIVKVSGSDWTIVPEGRSISGDAHAAVERHLRHIPVEHVSLRPNAWMQVSLENTIRQVLDGSPVAALNPDAGVGYIDARDIADVAVQQLLAEDVAGETLDLTGPEVKTARQVAVLLSATLGRPVPVVAQAPSPVGAEADFEVRAVGQFATLIAAGHAAVTTGTVAALLGRPPRSVEDFVAEYRPAEAARAG